MGRKWQGCEGTLPCLPHTCVAASSGERVPFSCQVPMSVLSTSRHPAAEVNSPGSQGKRKGPSIKRPLSTSPNKLTAFSFLLPCCVLKVTDCVCTSQGSHERHTWQGEGAVGKDPGAGDRRRSGGGGGRRRKRSWGKRRK